MSLHPFKGPVTNDKTAVFIGYNGATATFTDDVTASDNLVKDMVDAADDDARWTAVKTWAGAADARVIRLPAALTELPNFHAPPNRQNIEVIDGDNQTVQLLGIGQTPDLDLTIALFDPSDEDGHGKLAKIANNTMLDLLVMTATDWKADNAEAPRRQRARSDRLRGASRGGQAVPARRRRWRLRRAHDPDGFPGHLRPDHCELLGNTAMKISDLSANTDLLPLWPDEGVSMRPMTQRTAKRLRDLGRSASRLSDLADAAEDEAEAEELRGQAAETNREFVRVMFTEVVCDDAGAPLEGDLDDVSATLVTRTWARIEEVHREMGKSRRRASSSGSAPEASTPTTSA